MVSVEEQDINPLDQLTVKTSCFEEVSLLTRVFRPTTEKMHYHQTSTIPIPKVGINSQPRLSEESSESQNILIHSGEQDS